MWKTMHSTEGEIRKDHDMDLLFAVGAGKRNIIYCPTCRGILKLIF